jgi:YihY family inner membrane protein
VSTAHLVPETWELSGDDARVTLKRCGRWRLMSDAFQRMRWADGFSHARSMAFMVSLAAIQGMIALVGLARAFGDARISDVIVRSVKGAAPGPVADLLTTTISQAQHAGAAHNFVGLMFGGLGWLVTATTAMGQLERGLNRIYGVERDRPAVQKYGFALVLAVSVGALLTAAVGLLAFGRAMSHSINSTGWARAWDIATWPVGLGLALAAMALLFRWSPRRRQPAWSWLAFGSSISVGLWFLATVGLGAFFAHSGSFGETYGPLAGMVAFLLWSLLSSIALFFGAAIAAQLEAVRADAASPQDDRKVAASEPDASEDSVVSPSPVAALGASR